MNPLINGEKDNFRLACAIVAARSDFRYGQCFINVQLFSIRSIRFVQLLVRTDLRSRKFPVTDQRIFSQDYLSDFVFYLVVDTRFNTVFMFIYFFFLVICLFF